MPFSLRIIHRSLHFWRTVGVRFKADGCANRAAALAFATLLSLVPLLAVSFAILTAFPISQQFALKIQTFVFDNFVAASAEVVQQHLQAVVQQTSKLSGIGMLLLLATAVLMVFNMEQAFNAIWRTKKQRSFISAFLMYWAVLTLTPILIGVGLAVSAYLATFPFLAEAVRALGLKKLVLIVTPCFSTLVAFTLLYLAVPNCKVRFRFALFGGIVAMALFELAKQGFVWYITHFPVYRLLYGALAAIPIFLVWIYLSWLIILFGAVVSAVMEMDYETARAGP